MMNVNYLTLTDKDGKVLDHFEIWSEHENPNMIGIMLDRAIDEVFHMCQTCRRYFDDPDMLAEEDGQPNFHCSPCVEEHRIAVHT